MKNKGLFIVKILLALVLVFGVISFAAPAEYANAASANKKAQTALKKKIKNLYCKYAFADIDKDGIDELITYQFGKQFDGEGFEQSQRLVVYKYLNGKAVTLVDLAMSGPYLGPEFNAEFYYTGSVSYAIISEGGDGGGLETVLEISDDPKEVKVVAGEEYWAIDGDDSFWIGDESVTAKKYNSYLKSIKKGKKIKVKLKSPSKKITNAYLKKMYKGVYEELWKWGRFNDEDYDRSTEYIEYDDVNGDGITEMTVNLNDEKFVFYVDTLSNNFHVHHVDIEYYLENMVAG